MQYLQSVYKIDEDTSKIGSMNILNIFFRLQLSSMEINTEKPSFVLMLKMTNY